MAHYTGPKNKLSRRAGIDLFGKGPKLRRLNIPPGVHGPKGTPKRPSEYLKQLKEKQKVKRIYGVLERQFRRYFQKASEQKRSNTGKILLQLLERRLDNTVYRLGLAPTRPMARQLITHGHVTVDQVTVDRPSFLVKPDQVIALKPKGLQIPAVKKSLESKPSIPQWLKLKGAIGKVVSLPQKEHLDFSIDEQLIIEYYSR